MVSCHQLVWVEVDCHQQVLVVAHHPLHMAIMELHSIRVIVMDRSTVGFMVEVVLLRHTFGILSGSQDLSEQLTELKRRKFSCEV